MIYTVTTSPSLDLIMQLPNELALGQVNRVVHEELRPGGKGINISIMLHNLGVTSTAFGFVAGFSGDELMRLTAALGVKTGFLRVRRGRTRINVRLKEEQKSGQTSINGLGPEVSSDDIAYLVRKIAKLTGEDYLVLAGMVPPSLPQDIYSTFFECLSEHPTRPKVVVDAPAEQFKYVLKYGPFLVKPNLKELETYFKTELKDAPSVLKACAQLQSEGARNILVSLGAHGAIFLDEHQNSYRIAAPGGTLRDKTGAGDSMIAGFLADYQVSHSLESAAYMAVAAGSATATTSGIADKASVMALRAQMKDHSDWGESLI